MDNSNGLEKYKEALKKNKEVYLRVKARPGAAKTGVKDIMADQTLKIDIAAPAVKGKANQELIKFLAGQFAINKNNVKIISGAGERIKLVKIVR